jgi:hypothetical protein
MLYYDARHSFKYQIITLVFRRCYFIIQGLNWLLVINFCRSLAPGKCLFLATTSCITAGMSIIAAIYRFSNFARLFSFPQFTNWCMLSRISGFQISQLTRERGNSTRRYFQLIYASPQRQEILQCHAQAAFIR